MRGEPIEVVDQSAADENYRILHSVIMALPRLKSCGKFNTRERDASERAKRLTRLRSKKFRAKRKLLKVSGNTSGNA